MIAGPRKGVIGPFIALLRSPELLDRMGRVRVVDLTATVGYFVAVSYVMNVAGTPPSKNDAAPLAAIRR